jgi:hypothetical protein
MVIEWAGLRSYECAIVDVVNKQNDNLQIE